MGGHRIRKGDTVKVISGKARGNTGKVLRVDRHGDRVYVEGQNIQKRHKRPVTLRDTQRQQESGGGIIESEGPIHISNVMLVDPAKNKPTRVGIRRDENGKRVRYAKSTGEAID
jgi:large subunit ribosomal protein L24